MPPPPPRHPLGRLRFTIVPQTNADARGAGAVLPDDDDAENAGRQRGQQVPSERAEAGRVRERARRAGEPGSRPAAAPGVQFVVHAAVLPAPGRARRPGRGRVPVHGAAGQRAGHRAAERPR